MELTRKLKRVLRRPYYTLCNWLFDPLEMIRRLRALPYFARNLLTYNKLNRDKTFDIRLSDVWYRSHDRFANAGTAEGHYFYQDLWAAQTLYDDHVKEHVDVGSRIDGFIAHVLPFCKVYYVDIRPLDLHLPAFEFRQGSITEMPFGDNSIPSLSSLHVIEHIGLGRYGDTVDPYGYLKAAGELSRILAPLGRLLLGTPVGRQRLCFDAHRIFDPQTIIEAFRPLHLAEFLLIDDRGLSITRNASFDQARRCNYGCGLFVFEKRLTN